MTAPEQAPATVEGLMRLALNMHTAAWAGGKAFALGQHDESARLMDEVLAKMGQLNALASRLSAPPAPQGEPVAWAVYVQDASKKWRVEQLYTLAENAQGYAHKRKQLGETAFVSPLSASPPPPPEPQEVELLTDAAKDVLAERQRQISVEGYKPEHDDEHSDATMANAAACYAMGATFIGARKVWPWAHTDWKPRDERSNMVRAGALILAEIERLDRAKKAGLLVKEAK